MASSSTGGDDFTREYDAARAECHKAEKDLHRKRHELNDLRSKKSQKLQEKQNEINESVQLSTLQQEEKDAREELEAAKLELRKKDSTNAELRGRITGGVRLAMKEEEDASRNHTEQMEQALSEQKRLRALLRTRGPAQASEPLALAAPVDNPFADIEQRPPPAAAADDGAAGAPAPAYGCSLKRGAEPSQPSGGASGAGGAGGSSEAKVNWLVLGISLDRRADRWATLQRLPWAEARPERMSAVDGRTLDWDVLEVDGVLHPQAVKEGRWAESNTVPTICAKSNSFSPHLTKAAVGCALSHRAAWERLAASSSDWALIVEDDVHSLAPNFCAKLRRVLRDLPPSWKFCYLGYHESSGDLLRASDPPRLVEVPADATITGLFGYLLRRSAARALLEEGKVFPLRNQVDVAMKSHDWRGGRYGAHPECSLLASPRSEDGACDTDVQTLGKADVLAHTSLMDGMYTI